MSPASYLTAPPRVAVYEYTSSMSALTWPALVFLLVVLGTGLVGIAVAGLGTWRQIKAARATSGAAVHELASGLEGLEARLVTLERRGADLRESGEHLASSLRRVRALRAAVQDVRATLDVFGFFLPRK